MLTTSASSIEHQHRQTAGRLADEHQRAAVPPVDDRTREGAGRANGQLTIAENLFNDVLGVALGAVLFAGAAGLPFYVDAATFGLGALFLSTIRRPLQGEPTESASSLRADIPEGFRFLFGQPMLRGLASSVATTMLALHIGLGVMGVLVVDDLGARQSTFGTILAVGSRAGHCLRLTKVSAWEPQAAHPSSITPSQSLS